MSSDDDGIKVSIVIQMAGLKTHWDGTAYQGDLKQFAEDLTRYFEHNIRKWADPRKGDLFIALAMNRGEEKAGCEYRNGRYLKEEEPKVVELSFDPAWKASPLALDE